MTCIVHNKFNIFQNYTGPKLYFVILESNGTPPKTSQIYAKKFTHIFYWNR